jgi:hypothetical protein
MADKKAVQQGADQLQAWLAKHGGHPNAAAVYLILGRTCIDLLDDAEKGLQALVKADSLGIEARALQTDLCYRIATVARADVKDLELAARYYRKFIREFDTDHRAYLAKQYLKDMEGQNP